METIDSIKRDDKVSVSILGPDGQLLYQTASAGNHSIEQAINDAVQKANLQIDPEICSFKVSNLTTGISHDYRLNAHGHIKLIV